MARRSAARVSYRVTFALLVVAVTAFSLIQSLLLPVMSGLAEHFHTDRATVTWLLTAYLVSASVATPLLGRLGDAWGKDRVLVLCLVALAVGCAVSALAPNLGWMIAGRAVQGVGGGILPVSFGIIRDELPPEKVPFGVSVVSSLLAFGIGVGIVVAGPVVDLLGYAALSWLPCAVSGLAALATYLFLPPSRDRSREPIAVGAAVGLAAWLVPLLLGISQAPRWGWTSPTVLALLVAGCVLLVAWVRAESRSANPLVDMRLMRSPGVWTANLVAFLVGFGLYSSSTLIPQLAQASPAEAGFGLEVGVTESGLMMLPSCLVSFVMGLVAAPAAARVGGRSLIVLGSLVSAGGMASLALFHQEKWQIYLGATLGGLGTGLTLALLANQVVAAVLPGQTGVATGMNANLRTIGGAVGSAVIASVLSAHTGASLVPTETGYEAAFLAIVLALTLAAVVGLAIPRTARPGLGSTQRPQPLTCVRL